MNTRSISRHSRGSRDYDLKQQSISKLTFLSPIWTSTVTTSSSFKRAKLCSKERRSHRYVKMLISNLSRISLQTSIGESFLLRVIVNSFPWSDELPITDMDVANTTSSVGLGMAAGVELLSLAPSARDRLMATST